MKMTTTQEPFTWGEIFEKIQKFSQFELPSLNDRIVEGKGCVYEISNSVDNNLTLLVNKSDFNQFSRQQATDVLRCVAPIYSSVHRHLETFKHPHNHFSQLFSSDSENFLLQLGKKACLPPRDSHYSTWILNSNPVYRFDTNPGWLFFWEAVRLTNNNNHKILTLLEEITNGFHDISSKGAEGLINEAILYATNTFNFYKGFVKGGMAPEYFSRIFRTYFLEYSIKGKKISGSNATNVASVPALDFKIGITDAHYIKTVKIRFQYYTQEDINFVNNAIKEPSILQLIIEALGFDFSFFKYSTIEEIMATFNKKFMNDRIKRVFTAVDKLVNMLSSWSKQHFGLINTYLIKEEQKMTKCPLGYSSPVVSFSQGVGGATHEETKGIRDMRVNNETLKKLKLIFKL